MNLHLRQKLPEYLAGGMNDLLDEIPRRGLNSDDAFFNRNWAGACWNRWVGTGTVAGLVRWLWTLDSSTKTRNKEDRRGVARCRSDA